MFSWQLLSPLWNSVTGQMLAFVLVIQQLWPLWSLFLHFSFFGCEVLTQAEPPLVPISRTQRSRGSWGQLGMNSWALGSREAMKQELRTSLRSSVICVCAPEHAEWTPALSQELRTAPSTALPCQALHKSWSFGAAVLFLCLSLLLAQTFEAVQLSVPAPGPLCKAWIISRIS